ncbi:uncharacterized protein LOC122651580 [Telopea speciosissima]|uniref:uncharacterized protein LOC122651580 n=1 Tax=Telopea speciosissima TaxID=54955 RepID=UPI001CC7961F|nr:uncharacterized protein LOC122651580 [Telopea speciosissima]
MAFNYWASSLHSRPLPPIISVPKCRLFLLNPYSSSPCLPTGKQLSVSFKAAAQSEGTEGGVTEDPPSFSGSFSSARTQLDLLEQLTSTSSLSDGYESGGDYQRPTIRDQLSQLVGDREGEEFSIPLGKNLKTATAKFLTISQKRNIKRQAYLNEVSRRNDSVFFATIGAFVLLPPVLILGVAVLTGYVQLFP